MDANHALDFTNCLLGQQGHKKLNCIESTIFREVWKNPNKTYKQIADETNYEYTEGTINTTAYNMWRRLTELFEENVTKNRFREVVESYIRKQTIEAERKVDSIVVTKISFIPSSDSESEFIDFTSSERRKKYEQALEFIKAAGSVESWADLQLILKAFNIYQQLGDIDQAANLFLQSIDTSWERREHIGTIAYRLGFLTQVSSAINWLIEKIETGWYLPATAIAHLYNEGGDLIWMSSNNTLQAIPFHQKAQEYAYRSHDKNIIIASEFNQALCNIDREEIEETIENITQGSKIILSVGDGYDYRRHEIAFSCLSAYVETLKNKRQASELAEQVYSTLLNEKEFKKLIIWEKNNLPIYAARALQNIGSYGRAFEMYMKAASFAKASGCIQVEAQSLTGKALLYYLEDKRFSVEKSITWLLEASRMFELINAEGDQAHVNLLLGVMFKELGKTQESQRYFKEAEKFYMARNAPQKIIRLNQIRDGDSLI